MHQSKALVDLSRITLFLKIFVVFSGPEIPKNRVKYVFFKDVSKNHVLGLELVKSDRF
jgi:hypothetical protein